MGWSPPASDAGWQPPEEDVPKPESDIALDMQPGGVFGGGEEAAASVLTGVASSMVPAYLGKSAMNAAGIGNGEDPLETKRRFEREHTYTPQTEEGRRTLQGAGELASRAGAALSRGATEAGAASSARFPSVAGLQAPSGSVTDVTKDMASRAGEVLNELPLLTGAVKGARALLNPAEAAEAAAAIPEVAPPKPVAGPVTADELRAGPDPFAATSAPAPVAPAPAAPAAPVRVPVPGKPHITPKAAPAAPEAPTPGHPVTDARGVVHYATAQELLERGGTVPPAEPPAAAAPTPPEAPSTPASAAPPPPAAAPKFIAPQQEGKASGSVSEPEQGSRTQTLHDLNDASGGRLPEVRTSAVSGGYDETGQDFYHAKSPDEGGARMGGVIAGENEAMKAASGRAAADTGGVAKGVEPVALQERGTIIDRALTGIRDWFDTNVGELYKGADAAAGGVPVTKMDSLHGVLSDPSRFTGAEGMQLHGDVTSMAKHFGLMGEDGFWKPATVQNVERFRQWVGDQYTPRTGKAVRAIKDALDKDIAAHGGADFYPKARALRQKQDAMIEDPKGISKLIPEKNPDGTNSINRPVPVAGIADHVANMPKEQFDHVINTLRSSAHLGSGELAENAAAALREIKAHMAERLHEAGASARDGTWDPYKYHEQLSKYSLKMPSVFHESEIGRFKTLNDAGNVLRMDKRYPGASASFQIQSGAGLRERFGNAGEGIISDLVPPGVNTIGELTGVSQAIRDKLKGNAGLKHLREVETRITRLGERGGGSAPAPSGPTVTPLGQQMGGRQGGFIGTREQRETVQHKTAPGEVEGTTVHTYSPPGFGEGTMRVEENPALGARQVYHAHVRDKGQGWGTSMLARAAQDAHDSGQVLRSDKNVSLGQAGAYENLKKLGYDVIEKPNDTLGGAKNAVGDHVFEVRPKAAEDVSALGQKLYGGRQRGAVGDLSSSAKMSPEDFKVLRDSLDVPPNATMRERWDAMWRAQDAGKLPPNFLSSQYKKGLNDSHIDTALRTIGKSSIEGETIPGKEVTTLGQKLYGGKMRGGPKFTPKAEGAPAAAEETPYHEGDWLGAAPPAKEAPAGRSMVNVGLHQGDPAAGGRVIPPEEAQQALRDAGVPVHRWNVQQSGTEPTLVASLHRPATDAELHGVAEKLGQQAVSQRHPDGSGTMHGPGVDSQEAREQGWDKFNGDYFRMHDGRTATEHAASGAAEEIPVHRAGGPAARYGREGGPTFFSEHVEGAKPYGQPEPYTIRPSNVFDTTYAEHLKLYQQFQKETGHPAGYKGNYPFWTAEPELKKWLDSQGHHFDAVKFGENTGHASYAVYDKSAIKQPPKQTVTSPVRNAYPGIYDDPHAIISRLEIAKEDPILRQLFGVTRKDLSDTALGREGNLPGTISGAAPNPKGSKAASKVMTPKNENRLVGLLNAAKEYPDLHDGMTGWYGMDPLHDAFVKELGPKTGTAAYSRLNHFMGMASPGSDVATEINRGTAANMLNEQGKLSTFLKQGGRPMGSRGRPAELANVSGHPYHSTAQGGPMREFARTGNLSMGSPKVPMYIQASGTPETGFQTRTPVGDSHWSRGVGLSDVRTNQGFGSSVTNPEMSQLGPWYRDKVAARAALPAISAQALQWGALGGETGVTTAVGAPKLELFAQSVKKAADRAGVTPEEMLRRIIRGTAHAG